MTTNARRWAGLAVLALPCLLVSLDAGVLYLASPQLTADLRPSSEQLLWMTEQVLVFRQQCKLRWLEAADIREPLVLDQQERTIEYHQIYNVVHRV